MNKTIKQTERYEAPEVREIPVSVSNHLMQTSQVTASGATENSSSEDGSWVIE